MRTIATTAILLLSAAASTQAFAEAKPVAAPSDLKPFNVTVRRFDPLTKAATGTDFVLPVDSPDAEHACASTIANAAAFSKKVEDGKPLPVAFTCAKIEAR